MTMHTKQKRHLIETRRRRDGPETAIGQSKWTASPQEVGPYLSHGIVGRLESKWAHHCSSFLSGFLSEDVNVCRGTERTWGRKWRACFFFFFFFSPPFFWSVFIGTKNEENDLLAWFWPVTAQLPCPFSRLWEFCTDSVMKSSWLML